MSLFSIATVPCINTLPLSVLDDFTSSELCAVSGPVAEIVSVTSSPRITCPLRLALPLLVIAVNILPPELL